MAERPDTDSSGDDVAGSSRPDARDDASAAAMRRQSRDLLRRIADTLDVPVDSLYRAASPGARSDERAELLRLWAGIEAPAARRAVLDAARAAAGRKPPPEPPAAGGTPPYSGSGRPVVSGMNHGTTKPSA